VDTDRQRRWIDRHGGNDTIGDPSPFVREALALLGPVPAGLAPRALDVACGRGRHALAMAAAGYAVDAVDYALPALQTLRGHAARRGLTIRCLAADVTTWPLPPARYALVVVVSFLERSLHPALRAAVAPGGALLIETFARDAAAPVAPERALAPGELDAECAGWQVLARRDLHVEHAGRLAARTGILARRPASAPH